MRVDLFSFTWLFKYMSSKGSEEQVSYCGEIVVIVKIIVIK